jgi:hypothetical protein
MPQLLALGKDKKNHHIATVAGLQQQMGNRMQALNKK